MVFNVFGKSSRKVIAMTFDDFAMTFDDFDDFSLGSTFGSTFDDF